MQDSDRNFLKCVPSFTVAFETLTNLKAPFIRPDDKVLRRSLYFYPAAGLWIGIAAAALPVFIVWYFSSLQAFALYSGAIYIFMLGWLTRFSGCRDFCRFSDALAPVRLTPEERIERMRRDAPGAAGVSTCAILTGAKFLAVYLLFTRLALYDKTMLLAFVLATVPLGARITMMFAARGRPSEACPNPGICGKANLFYAAGTALVFGILTTFFLGTAHGFGEFISPLSGETTLSNLRRILDSCTARPDLFTLFLMKGLRDTVFLFLGGILAWMYGTGEAKKSFGGMTPETVGAIGEIAECALLLAYLLIADYMLF